MSSTEITRRCGKCKNCLDLRRVQERVLACVNSPFSSATDAIGRDMGVVELWNEELARLPCLGDPDTRADEVSNIAGEEIGDAC